MQSITKCPKCEATEFVGLESYAVRCWLTDDNPSVLECKSGDGGLDFIECESCGTRLPDDVRVDFV